MKTDVPVVVYLCDKCYTTPFNFNFKRKYKLFEAKLKYFFQLGLKLNT